jgi:hypothetical protein
MTRASDLEASIAKNKTYAANYVRAGKDPAKYEAKIAAETAELAALKAAPVAAPARAPAASGLTNYSAAEVDAGFVFQASLGNTTGADTNPAPGAAKAMGFSGVVGSGNQYGIFRDGALTETTSAVPSTGWGFAFGLTGFNNDDSYTGPGAARP